MITLGLAVLLLSTGIVTGIGLSALFGWLVKHARVDDEVLLSAPRGWR